MAAKAQCPGCDTFTGPLAVVLKHQRGCEPFAELYRSDPDAALVDPIAVYLAAHPAVEVAPKPPREPKVARAPRLKPRGTSRPEPASLPSRPQGAVQVEYWSWQPTMLEELQAASKS
jgi:hypothetical protein